MTHYRTGLLCREPKALGKAKMKLGEGFAERRSRQRPHGERPSGKHAFAESHLTPSRQRVCREPATAVGNVNGTVTETRSLTENLPSATVGKEISKKK